MKYIDDLDELRRLVEEAEEPIVYPVREEGMIFLDYFRYTNELYRYETGFTKFMCIAKEELPPGYAQRTIQKLPVIPLKYLIHCRKTATFFVASPKDQLDYIVNLLENFDCENVVVITENIFAQMKNKIEELEKSGHIKDWHLNYFMKKVDEMEYRIAEQLELRDTNTRAFSEYRNAFHGKKVVIVGTGPTLKYYKPMKGAIHMGLNFAWQKEDIQFDYLFNTHYSTIDEKVEEGFNKIREKIFIGKIVEGCPGLRHSEQIYSLNNRITRAFFIHNHLGDHIYQDICYHPLYIFGSVVFPALQFALFTHPKEIYFVGCDVTQTGHWNWKKIPQTWFMHMKAVKIGYARMKMFAEQYYPDTKIISVNPVGLKGLFEDTYTDEYKEFLSENK